MTGEGVARPSGGRSIVFLGETGSMKSSMGNRLFASSDPFAIGMNWSSCTSRTEFFTGEAIDGLLLTVGDTMGFADSFGRNRENLSELVERVQERVPEVNAFVFFIPSHQARLSTYLQRDLMMMNSMFGGNRELWNHTLLAFTSKLSPVTPRRGALAALSEFTLAKFGFEWKPSVFTSNPVEEWSSAANADLVRLLERAGSLPPISSSLLQVPDPDYFRFEKIEEWVACGEATRSAVLEAYTERVTKQRVKAVAKIVDEAYEDDELREIDECGIQSRWKRRVGCQTLGRFHSPVCRTSWADITTRFGLTCRGCGR
jgi:hypothetical protein